MSQVGGGWQHITSADMVHWRIEQPFQLHWNGTERFVQAGAVGVDDDDGGAFAVECAMVTRLENRRRTTKASLRRTICTSSPTTPTTRAVTRLLSSMSTPLDINRATRPGPSRPQTGAGGQSSPMTRATARCRRTRRRRETAAVAAQRPRGRRRRCVGRRLTGNTRACFCRRMLPCSAASRACRCGRTDANS